MTTDEALREAQKWLDYLEAQKARATKMQELAHLAKTDQKEAQRQMRQMDQQPTVYDGARLADGVRVMVAEIERLSHAVRLAASQKLPDEMEAEDKEFADWEHGYKMLVKLARAAHAKEEDK